MSIYLVTGGAGFIGSHLVDELLSRRHEVRVLDSFSTGRRENLPHHPRLTLIEGDVTDLRACRLAMGDVDYVLHQAAVASVARSIEDPVGSSRTNIDGTLNVLVAARDAGVRRVVYAGSSSVYGEAAILPTPERAPAGPRSPYAIQKLVGEQYSLMFPRLYGLDTVVLRYYNVFGPRQPADSSYGGVIAAFVGAMLSGCRPIVYGDGHQTRDFVYVSDVVDAAVRACTASEASGMVINVGAGRAVSLNGLLNEVAHLIGCRPRPQRHPERAGDVRHSQADTAKARELLGCQPAVRLDEGLRRTIAWMSETMAVPSAHAGVPG